MDRAANTKAVLQNKSTFKSTKIKPYFSGYQSMQSTKSKPNEMKKSGQISLKTVRQKMGKGQGFDSPALNENEM